MRIQREKMKLFRFIKVSITGILSGLVVLSLLEHGFTKIITILSVMGMLSIIDLLFDIFMDYEEYENIKKEREKFCDDLEAIEGSLKTMQSFLRLSQNHINMHESAKTLCNQECWKKNTEVTNENKQ